MSPKSSAPRSSSDSLFTIDATPQTGLRGLGQRARARLTSRRGRLWGFGAFGALALSAVLFGGLARAQDGDEGHGHKAAFVQRMINSRVDDALDAIKATPQQRTAIYAVRDRMVNEAKQSFLGGRQQHQQDLEAALTLFTADQFDTEKAAALKNQRTAEAQARWNHMADSALQAIAEVHGVLTPPQRQALAQYLREHQRGGHGRWR